jgi:ABC-type nitrate/sulfonate/bicarbonate transport system substrate-binding protein
MIRISKGISRYVALVVLCASLVLFTLACRPDNQTRNQPAGGTSGIKLILAENQFPQSAATIIAARKGYFHNHGLDVEVRRFPSGKLALDAVLGGGANFATVAETPVVFAGFANLPAVIVATISYSSDSCKVAARKDLGVGNPSALKGKKVATAIGTSAEFFMESFLKGNGLKRSDVEVVALKPQDMPSALQRGDIAAFFIWEPYIYIAQQLLGDRLVVFSGQQFYTETFNLATTKDFAQRNPAAVKGVLQALADAENHIRSDPDDAVATVADQIGMERAVLQNIWPAYHVGLRLDASLLDEMQAEAQWAVKSQKVKADAKIPDLNQMIYPELLREVKPDSVTIK